MLSLLRFCKKCKMRPKHEGNTVLYFPMATISVAKSHVASGSKLEDKDKYSSLPLLWLPLVNMKSWVTVTWLGKQRNSDQEQAYQKDSLKDFLNTKQKKLGRHIFIWIFKKLWLKTSQKRIRKQIILEKWNEGIKNHYSRKQWQTRTSVLPEWKEFGPVIWDLMEILYNINVCHH